MIRIVGGEATTLPGIGMIELTFMRSPFPKMTREFVKLYISSIGRDERPGIAQKYVFYLRSGVTGGERGFTREAGGDVTEEAKYTELRPVDYHLMTTALNMLSGKIRGYTPPVQLPSPR